MVFLRFRLKQWYRNSFLPDWDRFIHFRKCSCGHPLWYHQCYEHGTCIHGVCLAETFSFGEEDCFCDGFNSMWNKQYSTKHKDRRQITVQQEGNVD